MMYIVAIKYMYMHLVLFCTEYIRSKTWYLRSMALTT